MTDDLTTRRDFLRSTTALAATAFAAPAILGAEDKSGLKPPVIGDGDFRFECHHGWGNPPQGVKWRNTHGVAVDRNGLVYVKHQGDDKAPCDTVVVFDPDGKCVRSFGVEYAGGGHGVDIREEDGTEYLYLSDTFNRQIVKTDLEGEWVWKIRYPREAGVYQQLKQFRPTNVCFGPDGDLYVGDGYGASYIHHYDATGKWLKSWGGAGEQAGQMRTPHGHWLDERSGTPEIVVADRANARLQYFSLQGEPLRILQGVKPETSAQAGETGQLATADGKTVPVTYVDGISFPADIDIQGDWMLVPDLHARILIFGKKNQLVARLGYDADWTKTVLGDGKMTVRRDPSTWRSGAFVHPHDACFDKSGNIFVTEWVEAGRLTFLKRV